MLAGDGLSVSYSTCVRSLSHICITEPASLFQTGVNFYGTTHWNSYSKQKKKMKYFLFVTDKFTQREQKESPPQLHYSIQISRLDTQVGRMFS